jgi:hypothetical protein
MSVTEWGKCSKRLTVGPVFILHVKLAETKVAKSNVSSVIKQNVLWLQVTVNDIEAVQTFQSTEEFGSIESGPVDIETLLLLEMMEKLATIDEC